MRDLELVAAAVHPPEEQSLSMLPDAKQSSERLAPELERIAARLGPGRVLCPVLLEDHRMEWMCRWRPAPEPAPRIRCRPRDVPQPTFALSQPLRLAVQDNRPIYQGLLQLLAGARRVEGGWWDRTSCVESSNHDGASAADAGPETTRHVACDYRVAVSEHAGVLGIFQMRLAGTRPPGSCPALSPDGL